MRPTTDRLVAVALVLGAAVTLVAGVWCLFWPESFADAVEFPPNEHFVHDAGAFQIAIGLGLLAALFWQDAQAVVLAAFFVGNTIHFVNHVVDHDIGGRTSDQWLLALLSLILGVALYRRLRTLRTAPP